MHKDKVICYLTRLLFKARGKTKLIQLCNAFGELIAYCEVTPFKIT